MRFKKTLLSILLVTSLFSATAFASQKVQLPANEITKNLEIDKAPINPAFKAVRSSRITDKRFGLKEATAYINTNYDLLYEENDKPDPFGKWELLEFLLDLTLENIIELVL